MSDRESQRSYPTGTVIGRYTIDRCIGRGGMGAVYEATHNDLKKRVAIKALDPRYADDPEVSARFLREGESAARIQHPNVVDIYDVGRHGKAAYLVMELLVGEDLGALLKRSGALQPFEAVDYLLPVCAALDAAHDGMVIHRDLKPANIFLAKGPQGVVTPKLLDFGISKHIDTPAESLTSAGVLVGTPNYMAPEQAHGRMPVDRRTDVYALGVVLYQCVTGVSPFAGQTTYYVLNSIVEGRFERPRTLNPNLDPALEQVILQAMSRSPDDRFQTIGATGAALLPFSSARVHAVWAPVFRADGASGTGREAAYAEPFEPSSSSHTLGSLHDLTGYDPRAGQRRAALAVAFTAIAAIIGFGVYWTWPIPAADVVAVPVPVRAEPVEVDTPPPLALPTKPTFKVAFTVFPPPAQIYIDGERVGREQFEGEFRRDGKVHTLMIRCKGYRRHVSTFTDEPPPPHIALEMIPKRDEAAPSASQTATATRTMAAARRRSTVASPPASKTAAPTDADASTTSAPADGAPRAKVESVTRSTPEAPRPTQPSKARPSVSLKAESASKAVRDERPAARVQQVGRSTVAAGRRDVDKAKAAARRSPKKGTNDALILR